ncbi:MAG: hypothetical protein JXR46_02590 [Calditrichaceae bacterium]|nr:hypothetical protein [Calditrichaceae bacterium]MBN2707910.1 hypothetical protein [Calditrichaceae bacterium]RQV92326.1 MAG: hypothetical protein EH224_15920 [Calditrichota bacterium]
MNTKEKIRIEIEMPTDSLKVEHATCPNGHLLADPTVKINGKPSIKVKVRYKDQEGLIYLDPVYGSYENIERGISIPKGAVVDFFCPVCGADLKNPDEFCQVCSSSMFMFHLPHGGIIEGCLKKGCMFHKLDIVDSEQQLARLFTNDTMSSFL